MSTQIPVAATGLLAEFAEAGLIGPADFHVARRVGALAGEQNPVVILALALCVRQLRQGSVCLDLTTAHRLAPLDALDDGTVNSRPELAWPEPAAWQQQVAGSPAVAAPEDSPAPYRLHGSLLYLERYYQEERSIAAAVEERAQAPTNSLNADVAASAMAPAATGQAPDQDQQAAIRLSTTHRTSIITGGPGTGKTTTVARIIDALTTASPSSPLVALAAPTGKAAGRLSASVSQALRTQPTIMGSLTLYGLLGAAPGRAQRTYHRDNPLPYDVVVVDETSMVSLSMMAWLFEALAPDTRLILLGDPDQLASVEEGAVLADLARSGLLPTAQLRRNWRSNPAINRLAAAIQAGDPDGALQHAASSPACRLIPWDGAGDIGALAELTDVLRSSMGEVLAHAQNGDGVAATEALNRHRILCAHRRGPYGVSHWAETTRRWLTRHLDGYHGDEDTFVGQPLIMTRNNDLVHNGETAVIVRQGSALVAAVDQPAGISQFDPAVLDNAVDMHAMTIHRSQGSQFDVVSVVLPPVGSPLLTRELLYTAVTRARDEVRLYGSPEALRLAVANPTRRASGLVTGP